MVGVDPVSPFLPTLDRARAEESNTKVRLWWRPKGVDLIARKPSRVRRFAAILAFVRTAAGESLLRYPYVPSMPFALEEGLARLFERETIDPPECLRVELERRGSGDPYRGLPNGTPTFHGHEYRNALNAARQTLGELRATHPGDAIEVRTYAWPILWLTYGGLVRRELAIVVRPDGTLHGLVCRGAWL